MFGADRLVSRCKALRISATSTVRFARSINGKAKRRVKPARRIKKSSRNVHRGKSEAELGDLVEQSQGALSLARPFSVYYPPPHITPELADDIVLYKDDDILVINKPAGYSVHGGPEVVHDLSNYMENWCYGLKDTPHLAHRIDKVTSGVLILTRHADAARKFADMFSRRAIQKIYLALCVGVPLRYQGSIKLPIATADIGEKKKFLRAVLVRDADVQYSEETLGKTISTLQVAQTDYKLIGQSGTRCSLLELSPKTGFQHQLRVHLSDGLNTPILGDNKFAGPVLRRQANTHLRRRMNLIDKAVCKNVTYLHAYQVMIPEYAKKNTRNLTVTAPLPAYFLHSLERLGILPPLGHSLEMATWKTT